MLMNFMPSAFVRGAMTALAVATFLAPPALAQEQSSFEPEKVDAIEEIVRQYLLEHPEVVIDAIRQSLEANLVVLWSDPDSPILGNPDGDVVLVEFFDYRCPYCKVTAPRLQALIKEDPNLKVIMKEFPILSPQSLEGAKAAIAAAKQGMYEDFHFALMENPGDLGERHLRRIAKQVGADPDLLIEEMASVEIAQAIERNRSLGRAIGVTGTPAMFIGRTLIPGAVELDRLRELVAATRREAS
jgi:protein-disulfide isomerase